MAAFALVVGTSTVVIAGGERNTPPPADPCNQPNADADGDGLPNGWECGPKTFAEGTLDLTKFGANPKHKDIFIECDYMKTSAKDLQPTQQALDMVAAAFKKAPLTNPDGKAGITIHIDAGSHFVNMPAQAAKRHGNRIAFADDWDNDPYYASSGTSQFDRVKATNFRGPRVHAFHYCLFISNYADNGSSGLSRGIPASDFLVSLGGPGWVPADADQWALWQGGTLMHELGHNLGLQHGGPDSINYKPNYISIMSYGWQLVGLYRDGAYGTIDYSRFKLGNLNETHLVEANGISGPPAISHYATFWSCPDRNTSPLDTNLRNGIDWNCDGDISDTVAQSVNDSYQVPDSYKGQLTTWNDWTHLVFTGGSIGTGARVTGITDPAALEEITPAEFRELESALR